MWDTISIKTGLVGIFRERQNAFRILRDSGNGQKISRECVFLCGIASIREPELFA